MKTQALFASITLALAGSAYAAGDKHDHAHEHKPMHGGVVVEVKDIDYELVARPGVIQLHLRAHGKPADLSQASARPNWSSRLRHPSLATTPPWANTAIYKPARPPMETPAPR